jgi:hypothetical protein
LELRCSRTIPFEQLKQVLQGGNLVSIDMRESDAPTQLRYFPGQSPALGFAREWISQDLAVFAGHPALPYTLNCFVVRPISELAVTDPTLIVALDPLEMEGGALATSLLLLAAVVFGIVSLVLFVLYRRGRGPRRAKA